MAIKAIASTLTTCLAKETRPYWADFQTGKIAKWSIQVFLIFVMPPDMQGQIQHNSSCLMHKLYHARLWPRKEHINLNLKTCSNPDEAVPHWLQTWLWRHAKDEAVAKILKDKPLFNFHFSGKNAIQVHTRFSFCSSWWQTSDTTGLRWLQYDFHFLDSGNNQYP